MTQNSKIKIPVGIIAFALLMVSLFVTPFFGLMPGYCMGYYPGVMEKLQSCRHAREILGENAGLANYGLSCGTARTEGAFGIVTWRLPVRGKRNHGTYRFYLERHGGDWQMLRAELEVDDDNRIDIVRCRPVSR